MAFSFLPDLFDYLPTPHKHHPGIPLEIDGLPEAIEGLIDRRKELQPAIDGLSRMYTIGGETKSAKDFLFGTSPDRIETALAQFLNFVDDLNPFTIFKLFTANPFKMEAEISTSAQLKLDSLDQYDISLTEFKNAHQDAQPQFPLWQSTLSDADAASENFWPMLARDSIAYNLLFLTKVDSARAAELKTTFGNGNWPSSWTALANAGQLYVIDLRIFSQFPSSSVDSLLRFTPGTITLLERDPQSKDLTPLAVRVAGFNNAGKRVFVRGNEAESHWLYALQAAKVSATVYGIWLGHVYHWHIVTAAMFKGMTNNLSKSHRISRLLRPQSESLIQFDEILLLIWKFLAPPTSFTSRESFLQLIDHFADGRKFYDDDPTTALAAQGITEADFSLHSPWDKYPIAGHCLKLFGHTQDYVSDVVDVSYKTNTAVKKDKSLKNWLKEARHKNKGNIKGLSTPQTTTALKRLLTSLVYRVTMHGCSRLRNSLSPTLSYVSNFPVCFQRQDIPKPNDSVDLLDYLPRTGTIGLMTRFYDIFIYSKPYEALIPTTGIGTDLYLANDPNDPRNQALVEYRQRVLDFMDDLQPGLPQPHQWPRSIET